MPTAIELKFSSALANEWLRGISKKWDAVARRQDAYISQIGVYVFQDIMDHFDKEQGSAGTWAPWSESYAGAIAGHFAFRRYGGRTVMLDPYQMEEQGIKPPRKPGKILQDTGRMRNNFRAGHWRKVSSGIEWYNDAKTKSGFPYAYAHNEGGPILPKRDFMWLSEQALNKISEATLLFLVEE